MTTQEENATTVQKPDVRKGKGKAFLIFFAVLLVIGAVALVFWLHSRQFESTDDAQVDAHLNPISARVDGTITHVYVDDNQTVKVGQPLVDLDPRDYQAALEQALAQLAESRSMVIAQQPNVPITEVENTTNISSAEADVATAQASLAAAERDRDVSLAKVAEAEATNARAQADLARYQLLISKQEVSQQEYDQVAATAKAQGASLAASRASVASAARVIDQRRAQLQAAQSKLALYQRTAPRQVAIRRATVATNQASAQGAEAQVQLAQLKISYSKIVAPVAGIVMRRSAEVGAHVSAGQQLLQIAQVDDLWVTANFKETQLRNVRPKQSVTLHVDALKRDFEGYVESIGATTGAVASVLPPENATGNYVKIIQRIPVRIRFKPNQDGMDRLRPGMSVEPDVRIGS